MSSPESLPTQGIGSRQERLTTERLLDHLIDQAYNNETFEKGQVHQTGFTVSQGESLQDPDTPEGKLFVEYEFNAVKNYSDFGPIIVFQFSATTRREGVELPAHIAADAYGLPADEAVKEAGDCTLQRSITFNISTLNSELAVCESYTYIDCDGDVVSSICTCKDQDEITRFYGETDENEDEPSEDDENESTNIAVLIPQQRPAISPDHEKAPPESLEEALQIWSGVMAVEETVSAETDGANLKLAFSTFSRMKAALLKQAGVRDSRPYS